MTDIFYTANGDIKEPFNDDNKLIENMASISDIPVSNSVKGRKIKLMTVKKDSLNIAEITIFDENNIEIPKNKIIATQSTTVNPASNAIDNNTGTFAATTIADRQWMEFDLGTDMNISRIFINNRADLGTEMNRIKDVILIIVNSNNTTVFQYMFSNFIDTNYNIYVKYNYVIGKHIKILQPNTLPLSLNEITFFNENGDIIKTKEATQSSQPQGNPNPVTNLLDNNLDTFGQTAGLKDDWFNFNLGSDMKISRIILNNRLSNKHRILGAKLLIINNSNEIVYVYEFNEDLNVYNIEIQDYPWDLYTNNSLPSDKNYTLLKQKGDGFYCMSSDGINCLSFNYLNAVSTLLSEPPNIKTVLIDKKFMSNSLFKKEDINKNINNNLLYQTNLNNTLIKQQETHNISLNTQIISENNLSSVLNAKQETENKLIKAKQESEDKINKIVKLVTDTEAGAEKLWNISIITYIIYGIIILSLIIILIKSLNSNNTT
jgi:hypothetical protein